MKLKQFGIIILVIVVSMVLTACATVGSNPHQIQVVASTTMVGDVVSQIAGDKIELTILYPVGTDPHTFEPRPQDVAAISDAQVIFLNGLELEHSLEPVIESNARGDVIEVSDGVDVLAFESEHEDEGEEHDHAAGDPHTWMDPNCVMIWVENIEKEFSRLDPQNAEFYHQNAQNYLAQLKDLDAWIREEVDKIPASERKLVTDHENMGYFIRRYGFTMSGLLVDSLSTAASPSAQALSALQDAIIDQQVKAIFIGSTVNPALAQQIAKDTGVNLITIKTESLGEPGSETASYLTYMKTLVTVIVNGLQ